jgi:hypothetical protein
VFPPEFAGSQVLKFIGETGFEPATARPEDFDDFLRSVDPSEIQVVEAGSGATVTIVADATGEEAKRLGRIARETDPPLEDVLADLRGAAKPSAA